MRDNDANFIIKIIGQVYVENRHLSEEIEPRNYQIIFTNEIVG